VDIKVKGINMEIIKWIFTKLVAKIISKSLYREELIVWYYLTLARELKNQYKDDPEGVVEGFLEHCHDRSLILLEREERAKKGILSLRNIRN
jgi:hypothetical protein